MEQAAGPQFGRSAPNPIDSVSGERNRSAVSRAVQDNRGNRKAQLGNRHSTAERRCDMLLRNALGDTLRHARTRQNRTLRDVSTAANVSLGYLSEVERGRKEASSELLASICDALDLELSDLLDSVSRTMRTDAPADKSGVMRHSVTTGLEGASRQRMSGLESTTIDPTLRIVVPYGSTRPGAPVG
jgi:transcriptional regulator with XRE-family HTH domain